MPMTLKYKALELLFRAASAYMKDPARIAGLENIPPKGEGYIAAANHRSFVDGLLLPQVLVTTRNEPVHMVSYAYLFTKPFLRVILPWAEGLVLDSGTKEGVERFFLDAKRVLLEKHECIGLHPEAHIQRDTSRLGRGRSGAARLALETGCPVVPIALFGTDVVLPPLTPGVRSRLNYKRRALGFRAGPGIYFTQYREVYEAGDARAKKEILDGCTTIIMRAIARLTRQRYHFGERSLERLAKYR